MHFPIALVEDSASTYGFLNVYSATERAPEKTLEIFRQWCVELTNPTFASLQELVDRLHAEYLSHENNNLRGAREQIGWHRAFCFLSFALFSADQCWIVHLGDRTVARIEQDEVVRIAPIHDLQHEYAERTLDEAGLAELTNLTTEMAEAMVDVPAGRLKQLQGKTSHELIELLGSYNTRAIGYRGWDLSTYDHRATVELTPPNAYIANLPMYGELTIVILDPIPNAPRSAGFDRSMELKRQVRLEMESKWPSQNIDEVPVTETAQMTSQDLGIKIHWREGHPVKVSLLSAKE